MIVFWIAVLAVWWVQHTRPRREEAFEGTVVVVPIVNASFSLPGICPFIRPKTLQWTQRPGSSADSVVVHTDLKLDVPSNGQTKIAWLVGPPDSKYDSKRLAKFDRVITCQKKLLDSLLYAVEGPCAGTHLREEDIALHPKRLLLSAIIPGPDVATPLELQIADRWAGRIDIFGPGRAHPMRFKVDGLRDYAFTLVFESARVPNYYSEKIVDCFLTGTVPIYWGAEEGIREHFDPTGVIFLSGLDGLDKLMAGLSLEKYATMVPAVRENFARAQARHVTPEDALLADGLLNFP